MEKDSVIISEGGVEPCRVVERSYEDEIERLRRVERAANVLVEECRTLTGSLWPQNQTTKMLARVLDEFDRAALEGK